MSYQQMNLSIDVEKCEGCGECSAVCPGHAFEVIFWASYTRENCICCGSPCLEVCPFGAIQEVQE